ncbi:adhesion G protein-coupled receptor L3 isoform X1 [Ciona intestinalis]
MENIEEKRKTSAASTAVCPGKLSFWIVIMCHLLAIGFLPSTVAVKARSHDEIACQDYEMTLRCPGSDVINVQMASYGRRDDRTCASSPENMRDTHCDLPGVLAIVANRCNGKTECTLTVGEGIFEDPCPGTRKYLSATWECVPLIISCPGALESVTSRKQYVTTQMENAAWVRDPFQETEKIYVMGWAKYDTPQLYEFSTTDKMSNGQATTFHHLPYRKDGTGFVVYDGSIFYNKERSRTVVRYDFGTASTAAQAELPGANYHGTSPYAIEMSTDIDMAVDESGLWAIYATEDNDGNIVLSRLEPYSLKILNSWRTGYDKLSALNAFIVCGVLYAVNYETLMIDYMYNTTSNLDKQINIPIPGITRTTSSIEYNSKEHKLYVWDQGVAVEYTIDFVPITAAPPTTTTTIVPPTISSTVSPPTTTTPQSPVSRITTTTTTPTVAKLCKGEKASGLMWPDTAYSQIAILPCPGVSAVQAIWICGGNKSHPKWTTNEPDLSQCTSQWIKDLVIELGVKSASELSVKFVSLLRQKQQELASWDISMSIKLLRDFLDHAENEPLSSAATITDSTLKAASLLLDPVLTPTWKGLGKVVQTQLAVQLATILEDASYLLAKDMATEVPTPPPTSSMATSRTGQVNNVNWSQPFVTLGIRVAPIDLPSSAKSRKFQSKARTQATGGGVPKEHVTYWETGHRDIVKVNNLALIEASNPGSSDKLAVVFISCKTLGIYMEDKNSIGSPRKPVDSQVISISMRSINISSNNSPVLSSSSGHEVELKKPIQMTLQHRNVGFRHHVCAYWDNSGKWWRAGCRRTSGNSTHSTCECDHMTNFVVLSSNEPFPAMGADVSDPPILQPSTQPFIYLNVVRAGLVTAAIMLVFVEVTLIVYSKSLDVNTIHKNLVASLLLSEVVFLCGINKVNTPTLCSVVAGLLHFGILSVFTWSTLEAYHLLAALNDVLTRNNRWKWYYITGYGLPAAVVMVSAAVNHDGYGSNDACWLNSSSDFIWSFIGPCSILISFSVVFLFLVLYKLHSYNTNFPEAVKAKVTRAGAARACVLTCLLCLMWSFGVMWVSKVEPQLSACLFCVFCAFHALGCCLLYCILPADVRQVYGKCFPGLKTSPHRPNGRHRTTSSMLDGASGVRLVSTQHPTMRHDGTSYSDYHFTAGSSASGALLPVHNSQTLGLSKAAAMMDGGRMATSTSMSLPHDLVASSNVSREQRCMTHGPIRSNNVFDDTEPKMPTSVACRSAGPPCNQYLHSNNRTCFDGQHPNTHYEKPQYCECSLAHSQCSGRYDHLHECEQLRSPMRQHPHPSCETHRSYTNTNPHLYETLGPFTDSLRMASADGSSTPNGHLCEQCPSAVPYRHRYEDVEPRVVHVSTPQQSLAGSSSDVQHPKPQPRLRCLNDVESGEDTLGKSRENSSIGRKYIKMGTSGLRDPNNCGCYYNTARTGRSSDPLSTDQGYDTDSQQPNHLCPNPNDSGELPPTPPSNLLVRSVPLISEEQNRLRHIHSTPSVANSVRKSVGSVHEDPASDASDSSSENDREVELLTSAQSSRSVVDHESEITQLYDELAASTSQPQSYGQYPSHETEPCLPGDAGDRLSPTGTVSSWAAVPGSNPRSVNPSYGKRNSRKTTTDPKVILANARRRQESEESRHSDHLEHHNTSYTLPGTAAAGTKARIDLRTGGISMVTNL